jgi:hypothetical protein
VACGGRRPSRPIARSTTLTSAVERAGATGEAERVSSQGSDASGVGERACCLLYASVVRTSTEVIRRSIGT